MNNRVIDIKRIDTIQNGAFTTYRAYLDLRDTDSWINYYGEKKEVKYITFDVSFNMKHQEWRVYNEHVYKIVNESLGCVDSKLPKRTEKLEELASVKQEYKNLLDNGCQLSAQQWQAYKDAIQAFNDLAYNWNPCTECKMSQSCTKKHLVYNYIPKVHIFDESTMNTWLFAMNVGAAIARMINSNYPRGVMKDNNWVGLRKCNDCSYCKFIIRDNQMDYLDESMMNEAERSYSTSELRELPRDILGNTIDVKNMRCAINNKEIASEDACLSYVWKSSLFRKTNWVPASKVAKSSKDNDIIGGEGRYSVRIPEEVINSVQKVQI